MRLLLSLLLAVVAMAPAFALADGNKLPDDAASALNQCKHVVLYSLEPWAPPSTNYTRLHGFKILGQATLDERQTATAVAAFESAISLIPQMGASCFDPRHAVRVEVGGHVYDFLLCYACGYLYVYRDDKNIAVLSASGSPKVLNELLIEAKIPVSKSGK
jgi:hypothetical protein